MPHIVDAEPLPTTARDDQERAEGRWTAVFALSLGIFGLVTTEFLPTSLLTPIARDLAISDGLAGQTVTATALVAALAAPAVVLGARKIDRRSIVLGLSLLLILSNVLSAVAWNVSVLLVARVALGVALGAFWSLAASLALRLVPLRDLPRAMSIIFMGVSLASVSGAPLGAFLGDLWGWRATFLAASAIGVASLVVQIATVPPLRPVAAPNAATFATLLRRRNVQVGLATVLLVVSGNFGGFTYVRPFLEQVPRLDVRTISLVLLVFGVGGFVGNFVGGMIAARSAKAAVSVCALLISAAVAALAWFGTSTAVALATTAIWGLAFGGFPVAIQTWITRATSDQAEAGSAIFVVMWQVAIAGGAVIGGLLVDRMGAVGALGYCAASLLAGGLAILSGRTGPAASDA